MSVKKLLLATAVFAAFSSTPALADIAGTVTFLGNVKNSPCLIDDDKNRHKTVQFKGLSTRVLNKAGLSSDKEEFSLVFKDCTYTEGTAKATLTFNFDSPNSSRTDLVKVEGNNEKNLGIKITLVDGSKVIKGGDDITLKANNDKVNELKFTSEVNTLAAAVVGDFKAVANWTLHYK